VAEVVVRYNPVPMDFIGMKDRFGESGKPEELLEKYGMKAHHIVSEATRLILRKK
jgi:transketolase